MTENEKRERAMRVAKRLLSLANGTSFEGEKEAAMEKLQQLQDEYNFLVFELRDEEEAKTGLSQKDVAVGDKAQAWEQWLMSSTAYAFDCKVIYGYTYGGRKAVFVGYEADVRTASWFYLFISREIMTRANKLFRLQADRLAYSQSFALTASERLKEMYKKRRDDATSSCLSLMIVKEKAVSKFFDNLFPNRRSGSAAGSYKGSAQARMMGSEDGKKIGLGMPVKGGEKRRAISQ